MQGAGGSSPCRVWAAPNVPPSSPRARRNARTHKPAAADRAENGRRTGGGPQEAERRVLRSKTRLRRAETPLCRRMRQDARSPAQKNPLRGSLFSGDLLYYVVILPRPPCSRRPPSCGWIHPWRRRTCRPNLRSRQAPWRCAPYRSWPYCGSACRHIPRQA